MSHTRDGDLTTFKCDVSGCISIFSSYDEFLEIIAEIKKRGWKIHKEDGPWRHTCPMCSKVWIFQ